MPRNFRSLIAWQRADTLAVSIYQISTAEFPSEEKYGLTAQIRKAAVSVAANIAEGCGRESRLDFRRFLVMAQGSLFEVEYYLHLAHRLGFINGQTYTRTEMVRGEAGRTLQGLIRSADRRPEEFGSKNPPRPVTLVP